MLQETMREESARPSRTAGQPRAPNCGAGREPMGADPLEAGREIRVPSREREVAIGTFSAGETWSFSAGGEWSTGFVHCGPGGYRNPDTSTPTPALAVNDVFAPLFGLFASMSAHESHLAREMKLTGQPKVEA